MSSNRPKVLSIFGTRPEIIKFGPVLDALDQHLQVTSLTVFTNQHQHIALPFLERFAPSINHQMNVMSPDQSLNELYARILTGLDRIMEKEQPDCVLVQGDTCSALAGATAAFNRKIPVAHIEAGLRSGDVDSPFPEEMNRIIIDRMASLHFAATQHNRQTLLAEGVSDDSIFVTGNTIVDALEQILAEAGESAQCRDLLLKTANTRRILLTAHRRENFAGRMANYFSELREFLLRNEDVSLIYPSHPNPEATRIREASFGQLDRLFLVEPLDYLDFVRLMSKAWLLVSDSGGVQEEAPGLHKPLLILRNTTERPESIECGVAKLVGAEPGRLGALLDDACHSSEWEDRIAAVQNPFGDGKSGPRIAGIVADFLARTIHESSGQGA